MTVVLPKNYHIKSLLEQKRILCIDDDEAQTEDIRALRIGILNIMPQAQKYEFSLLDPLGRSIMQIEPVWLRVHNHTYNSSDKEHLDKLYIPFEEAIKKPIDGLILTGAPVEELPFEEITYWDEIQRILKYARNNISSTLGICWGGLALAKFMGINPQVYSKKIFGVYETKNLNPDHRITGEMDDIFLCPHSRHAGIDDAVLEAERDKGNINLLAHAEGAGYVIFESADNRFIAHVGHPEYPARRLVEEYERDVALGRSDVEMPVNFDVTHPVNRWRSHRNEFFASWIKYVHETTHY